MVITVAKRDKRIADQAEELRDLMQEKNARERVERHQHRTRVVVVTSGKGGVGKTNIATNMAIAYG
ncbi:MinD/ParA family protein, partial [Treponema pallidum]